MCPGCAPARYSSGRPPVPHVPERYLPAVHSLAGAVESPPSGIHARSVQFPPGQQALRLPSCRGLLAPQRGWAWKCSTGSTLTASTVMTTDGTGGWKTSYTARRDSSLREPPLSLHSGRRMSLPQVSAGSKSARAPCGLLYGRPWPVWRRPVWLPAGQAARIQPALPAA